MKRNYTLTSSCQKRCLPPVQATGKPAGSGHAFPAGHAVQFSNLPPKEYIPRGHGTGGLLEIIKQIAVAVTDSLMILYK